jgi:hypothetical protein
VREYYVILSYDGPIVVEVEVVVVVVVVVPVSLIAFYLLPKYV